MSGVGDIAMAGLTQYDGHPIVDPALSGDPADPAIEPNPLLDFSIPGAWDDPDLWDAVTFTLQSDPDTVFTLPPLGFGKVSVSGGWEVQLDAKGGAGKAKPRVSKKGGKEVDLAVKVECVADAWPYILAAAKAITPGSGPWLIGHPKASLLECTLVEIKKWKDAPGFADHGDIKWEIDCKQIKPAAQSGKGGGKATDTPAQDKEPSKSSNEVSRQDKDKVLYGSGTSQSQREAQQAAYRKAARP